MVFWIPIIGGILAGGAVAEEAGWIDVPWWEKNLDKSFKNTADSLGNVAEGVGAFFLSLGYAVAPQQGGAYGALRYWTSIPICQFLLVFTVIFTSSVVAVRGAKEYLLLRYKKKHNLLFPTTEAKI